MHAIQRGAGTRPGLPARRLCGARPADAGEALALRQVRGRRSGGRQHDAPLEERSRHERSFQSISLWEITRTSAPGFHPRVCASELLAPTIRLWRSALYENGGRETDAHQNQPSGRARAEALSRGSSTTSATRTAAWATYPLARRGAAPLREHLPRQPRTCSPVPTRGPRPVFVAMPRGTGVPPLAHGPPRDAEPLGRMRRGHTVILFAMGRPARAAVPAPVRGPGGAAQATPWRAA
jgi:hypothetical protein